MVSERVCVCVCVCVCLLSGRVSVDVCVYLRVHSEPTWMKWPKNIILPPSAHPKQNCQLFKVQRVDGNLTKWCLLKEKITVLCCCALTGKGFCSRHGFKWILCRDVHNSTIDPASDFCCQLSFYSHTTGPPGWSSCCFSIRMASLSLARRPKHG